MPAAPPPASQQTPPGAQYWSTLPLKRFGGVWRLHADSVNRALLERWFRGAQGDLCIKTDAFEEAVGEGPLEIPGANFARYLLLDCAENTLRTATLRHPAFPGLLCDARALPLRSSADAVLSLSTLDHFENAAELRQSLHELHRILLPGGTLLITLDNPANPIVWLRNRLPRRVREGSQLVPYFVGHTLSVAALRQELETCGFQVQACTAILHCPRILAIPVCRFIDRISANWARPLLRLLAAFELLEHLPTRYQTGHFIAVFARKAPLAL